MSTSKSSPVRLIVAFLLVVVAFDLIVLAWGETPSAIAHRLFTGTWGTSYGVGQVLFKATSIAIAAVAARIALRAGLFNIGVDGSIAVAAIVVGGLGAKLPAHVSPFLAWPLLALVGALVGALWAMPAAILRARFGAHEVISGIMLNKIASSLVGYLLVRGLAEEASVHTHALPPGAQLTRLDHLGSVFDVFRGSAVNVALLVGVLVVLAWGFVARRSILGRELAAVGASPTVAEASGLPVGRRLVLALSLSGAVAGLVSLNDVMGYKGYAEEGLSAGVGFTGLAAALLAGESTIGLFAASLLFATLSQGGLSINARVPMEIVDVVVALLILLVSSGEGLTRALLGEPRASRSSPTTARAGAGARGSEGQGEGRGRGQGEGED